MLERFEVFTPDARIVLDDGSSIEAPRRAYFRGEVVGDPASLAFLSVGEDGDARGLVSSRGRLHMIGNEEEASPEARLVARAVDEATLAKSRSDWRCEGSPSPPQTDGLQQLLAPAIRQQAAAASFTSFYTVEISVETDFELYSKFGNANSTADYVGDLFGAISAIYYRDIGTTLKVNYLAIYSSPGDPWTATSSDAALCELGTFWHNNRPPAQYPRDSAFFLSGKNVNSGIAWVGILCAGDFFVPGCGWGGAYGVLLGVDGIFSLTNPSFFWDIAGTAHEIGHNFNSPHTHCYNDLPVAGSPPVDQCFSGDCKGSTCIPCYQGATSVPAGGGTIMSYCQLKPGGFGNVNLSFGQTGLYGTQSERVPGRMRDFVVSRSCVSFIPARVADFNGEGRSDVVLYRNGQWLIYTLWPGS